MNPQVSVIMCVYNGAAYVADAVTSILEQSFTDFEFVIIDDGSTDDTAPILDSFDDPRIRLFHEPNAGLTVSLNKALKHATARYIARIDADERATTDRLARQVAFLDENTDIALLGSWCVNIDTVDNCTTEIRVPLEHQAIVRRLRATNAFVHGTVMFRREILDVVGPYDESFPYVQDYELWARIAARYTVANLPEVLLERKMTPQSISYKLAILKKRDAVKLRAQSCALRHLKAPWYCYGLLWWEWLVYMLHCTGIIRVPIKGKRDLIQLIFGGKHVARSRSLRRTRA